MNGATIWRATLERLETAPIMQYVKHGSLGQF